MATVKENGITKRIADHYQRQKTFLYPGPASGLFRVKDLLDCPRKAVMQTRGGGTTPDPRSVCDFDWRYLFRTMPGCRVIRENISLADGTSHLTGFIDILASYSNEMILVKLIERESLSKDPLKVDVTDMVVCMYLAALWHGVLIYHWGDKHEIYFLNPDRRDAKEILGWAAAGAAKLSDHILHETTPSGETNEHCSACPFMESCNEYMGLVGATEQSERDKI
jgi:hypothetical protein